MVMYPNQLENDPAKKLIVTATRNRLGRGLGCIRERRRQVRNGKIAGNELRSKSGKIQAPVSTYFGRKALKSLIPKESKWRLVTKRPSPYIKATRAMMLFASFSAVSNENADTLADSSRGVGAVVGDAIRIHAFYAN